MNTRTKAIMRRAHAALFALIVIVCILWRV
jgi:hypothetical protein